MCRPLAARPGNQVLQPWTWSLPSGGALNVLHLHSNKWFSIRLDKHIFISSMGCVAEHIQVCTLVCTNKVLVQTLKTVGGVIHCAAEVQEMLKYRKWSNSWIQEVVLDIWSRERNCGCGWQPAAQADKDEKSVGPDRSTDKPLPDHQSASFSPSLDEHRTKYTCTHTHSSLPQAFIGPGKIIIWVQPSAEDKQRPGCFQFHPFVNSCLLHVTQQE